MKNCKSCGQLIAKTAKTYPHCGAKNKKPIYKRGWFIAICIIFAISFISSIARNGDSNDDPSNTTISSGNAKSQTDASSIKLKLILIQRVVLRSCTNRLKPFQQSERSGNGTKRLSRIDSYFIIFGKAAGVIDPCQRTFNNPPLGQDLPYRFDTRQNIDAKPQFTGNILLKGFAVSGISAKPLNRWIGLKCFFCSPNSCLRIMYIGSMNYHRQQITL